MIRYGIVRGVTVLAAFALAAAMGSCRDPVGTELNDLEVARLVWAAQGPDSYVYEYRTVCFCAPAHLRITVEDGEVTEVEALGEQPPLDQGPPPDLTVDALFDRIAEGLDADPHRAEVTYDPTYGYPEHASFDPAENVIDEEWGFVVENFQVLGFGLHGG